MKKLFVLILALTSAGIINHVSAQCTPPAPSGTPGLSPDWECLNCVVRTQPFYAVINVENFDEVEGVQVNSLRIDSLTNVPPGLTYTVNPSNATFPGGGTGCINVEGTTTDTAGSYKLGIYVTVNITGIGDVDGEAGAIVQNLKDLGFIPDTSDINFDYFVRVIEPGATCARHDSCGFPIKVTELSDRFTELTAQPNPFNNQTQVSWTSNTSGQFTAKLVDVTGKEVFTKQVSVKIGSNNIAIERGDLPVGSYIFMLSDGRQSISTKLLVRE